MNERIATAARGTALALTMAAGLAGCGGGGGDDVPIRLGGSVTKDNMLDIAGLGAAGVERIGRVQQVFGLMLDLMGPARGTSGSAPCPGGGRLDWRADPGGYTFTPAACAASPGGVPVVLVGGSLAASGAATAPDASGEPAILSAKLLPDGLRIDDFTGTWSVNGVTDWQRLSAPPGSQAARLTGVLSAETNGRVDTYSTIDATVTTDPSGDFELQGSCGLQSPRSTGHFALTASPGGELTLTAADDTGVQLAPAGGGAVTLSRLVRGTVTDTRTIDTGAVMDAIRRATR